MNNDRKQIQVELGARLRDARQKAGLSQLEMAKVLNLPSTVLFSRAETGAVLPSEKTLRLIARALKFPEDHFIKMRENLLLEAKAPQVAANIAPPWGIEPGGGTLMEIYRSDETLFDQQVLKAEIGEKHAEYTDLENRASIRLYLFDGLRDRIRTLPDAPVLWAQLVRAHFQIGAASPLANLVQVLERAGARIVFTDLLKEETSKSYYDRASSQPIIALNKAHTSERVLNHLAMEVAQICYWCLNDYQTLPSRDAHGKSAQDFAAEFLLPKTNVTEIMNRLNLSKDEWTFKMVCEVKILFGVSALLFLNRLRELKSISDDVYSRIRKEIEENYGRSEPEPRLSPNTLQCERWLQLLRARVGNV